MTQPDIPGTPARSAPSPEGPRPLRRITLTALSVFLTAWALCWIKAYAVNDDLPNTCHDIRRQRFPTEVACASADGTLTGGNPGWLVALFFASLVVTVLCGGLALAVSSATRGR
ncbi:hypothetical protein OHT61_09230 [Streptomyces sp. NBC_00178]|uniref:hypothetical protein n=1 Tax=Streptomyces sp. NBC_00178 TaxID=2975672 RepID=UPI002E2A5FF2|nr:hypothetical protein [Streptomyces sp. NBC_00178]